MDLCKKGLAMNSDEAETVDKSLSICCLCEDILKKKIGELKGGGGMSGKIVDANFEREERVNTPHPHPTPKEKK